MIGLLAKARQLRTSLGLPADDRDEFAFDADSGISREEQTEIRAEIEKVATRSRMAVSPEVVRGQGRQAGDPLSDHGHCLRGGGHGSGVVPLQFPLPAGRDGPGAARTPPAITAEGKLIEELQKEADAQAARKKPADQPDPGPAGPDRQAETGPGCEYGCQGARAGEPAPRLHGHGA